MTALNKDHIPASVTTLEALVVWASEVLLYLNQDIKIIEALRPDGQPEKTNVVSFQKYYLDAPEIPEWRYIGRLSIGLRKDHLASGKAWEHTRIISDEVIPTAMRA